MSILIAFLGGMLTLLSPCTLPVIPLLFASVRGRRGQLAIMLAGMALMFGAVSWLVTVASGWVVNLTLAGRGLALAFFALVGLSLLSQRVAQRLSLIHISEPTRLGMISYAVFCLKKKKKKNNEKNGIIFKAIKKNEYKT